MDRTHIKANADINKKMKKAIPSAAKACEEQRLFEAEACAIDESTGRLKYAAGLYGMLLLYTVTVWECCVHFNCICRENVYN